MRERMQQIITAVNQGCVLLHGGKKLWGGRSNIKPKRGRAAHAALVRRVVRALCPQRESELETEYAMGSV